MTKTLVSAAILSAAFLGAAVQAQELGYPPAVPQAGTVTRAEVVQALQDSRAQGPAFIGELDPQDTGISHAHGGLSREQVVQERDQARAQGLISRGNLDYPPVRG
ncbi:DUF4148 domain-containing protein [Orrella sp. JC864]|uniref:DUF4148 domain-containing protein n=1 Tax=Orrella sp. JC864 TaxID=3120298 RepID=UPI00300A118E